MNASEATTQLSLANERQREVGLVTESSEELVIHIQKSDKAQYAIHNHYKASGDNFFLCCAHPPQQLSGCVWRRVVCGFGKWWDKVEGDVSQQDSSAKYVS